MNLEQFQTEYAEWVEHNFPNSKPYQPLLGALEELGELAHAHLKAEQGIRGSKEDHENAKVDAVGDTVIYLCQYCMLNGFTLSHALEVAWAEVRKRDWKADSVRGVEGTLSLAQQRAAQQ